MRPSAPALLLLVALFGGGPLRAQPEARFAPYEDCGARALALLASARQRVDVAQYNLRSEAFHQALLALRARGVRVRIVVDAKSARRPWNTLDDVLEAEGFDLVRYENTRSAYAIMHHKFAVIDGQTVLTGSYNWNGTAQLVNDEALLVLRDPGLVSAYEREFAELRGAPEVSDPGQGALGEVRFAPEDAPRDALLAAIRGAQRRVRAAVFAFKDRRVARALRDAARRGVEVTLITERKQADGTDADELVAAGGGRVIVAANRSSTYSAMHHKFAVVDDELVIAGASNWTWTAFSASNEDLLLLRAPDLAARFTAAFGALVRRYAPQAFDPADYGPSLPEAPTHFAFEVPFTRPGDAVLLVGDHPALGSWDPARGLALETSPSVFPTWAGRVRLPAGARIACKLVVRRADGSLRWELGADRAVEVDSAGTGTAVLGAFRELVELRFRVRARPRPGAELRLVGDDPALGNWDPARGWPLREDPAAPGAFRAAVPVPGRRTLRFKLVWVEGSGDARWEAGPDRTLAVHDRDAPQEVVLDLR